MKVHEQWMAWAATLILLLPTLSHGSEGTLAVTLRSDVEVTGDIVLLSDVAEVSGDSENAVKMLSEITVCSSPAGSDTKTVSRSDIRTTLSRCHIDLSSIALCGAMDTKISRKANELNSTELEQAVRDYVSANMPWEESEATIEFTSPLRGIIIPSGDVEYQVVRKSGTKYIGHYRFELRVRVDGVLRHSCFADLNIRVFKEIVVTSRQVRKNSIISSDDVEVKRCELKDTTRAPFESLRDVVGTRAIMTLPADRIVYSGLLEEAPAVMMDQYVTIRGRKGSILITTRGRTMEEGMPGEFIRVRNLASGQIVIARVTSAEIVDVVTAGSTQEARR
jgi:flagella basal body P-ring formation protein FlgA